MCNGIYNPALLTPSSIIIKVTPGIVLTTEHVISTIIHPSLCHNYPCTITTYYHISSLYIAVKGKMHGIFLFSSILTLTKIRIKHFAMLM